MLYLDVYFWVLTAVLGSNASDVFVLMFLEQYSSQIIETEHKNAWTSMKIPNVESNPYVTGIQNIPLKRQDNTLVYLFIFDIKKKNRFSIISRSSVSRFGLEVAQSIGNFICFWRNWRFLGFWSLWGFLHSKNSIFNVK